MGPINAEQLARELLELTRNMLALAKAGEWALLSAKEAERQQLSRDLFAKPVPAEAASTVADCVRQVLDVDQELIQLVEAGREDAARAVSETQKGKKAANAYRRFSR